MNNVLSILQELGYQVHTVGNSYRTKPLYRNSSSNNALSINRENGSFIDFARNIKGSFHDLIKLTLGFQSVEEAEIWLTNKNYRLEESKTKPSIKMSKTWNEEDIKFLFPNYSYWEQRGISQKTLEPFKGGVCHAGQLFRRWVFPIFSETGEIIGLSGRALMNQPCKWKHLGSTKIRIYPYFLNRKFIEESKEIILVEGISDMLALWEAGIKQAIVLFGINISDTIIKNLISINPKRIVIATNNDANNSQVGQQAALLIYNKLAKFFDCDKLTIGVPTHRNDLGEILQHEGIQGVKNWYEGLTI